MAELHTEHSAVVLRFLMKLTDGERFAAEDLLQDTMIKVWRSLDHVPDDFIGSRRWLLTVARRVAIDWVRRRRVRPAETGLIDLDRVASPDNTIDVVLLAESLRHAVSCLSDTHRAILSEVYFQGHSLDETASRLGIPIGTAKSRAHYALRNLRAAIALSA